MHAPTDSTLGLSPRARVAPSLLLAIGATAVPAVLAVGVSIGRAKKANDLAALALSTFGDAGVLSG